MTQEEIQAEITKLNKEIDDLYKKLNKETLKKPETKKKKSIIYDVLKVKK